MYVYLITNNINGKYYVGKTTHGNLNSYLSAKRCVARSDRPTRIPIINAMRKYGIDNFSVDVLATGKSDEEICHIEKLWIITLDSRNRKLLKGLPIVASG